MSSGGGPLALVRRALEGEQAWLVGGAVRDHLLGRADPAEALDLDVVVAGDPAAAAQRVRRAGTPPAAAFALSDAFGGWRVVGPGQTWQVDLTPLHEGGLEADLRARDLTINAIAEPLGGGELVDPTGGAADLAARRLRMVAPEAFEADPVRVLRLARLAVELGLEPDAATVAAASERAPGLEEAAGERVFAELRRIVGAPGAVHGLDLLDAVGATAVVLPELTALRGVEQTVYHHRDVHGHTLEVLEQTIVLQDDPEAVLGSGRAAAVSDLLAEPLADDLTRGGALRWGALLHDIAKPRTQTTFPDGRVGFPGHDREGAAMAREILTRLRASERLRAHVAALTRHHLRLGFLVHEQPLDRRTVHRYLFACEPVAADVTLLGIADRLATRGRKADEAIARHMELALPLLDAALEQRATPPQEPLVRGDELARALGIEPGPRLGELLAGIEEARYAGEATTADEAIAEARRLLEEPGLAAG
jgi:poly(A) polymerase